MFRRLINKTPLTGKEGDYLADRLAEEAENFIRGNADTPFFLMLSHYAVHAPLQGQRDKTARYEEIVANDRQGKPAYAAMVESVDDSVGRVMRTLSELKLDERTLVIFTSDNGGFAKATSNFPLRANKGSNYEGGLRVPFIVRWPGKIKPGAVSKVPVIGMDLFSTILEATGQQLRSHQHVDGESLVPILTRSGRLKRDAIYWHYPHYNQYPSSFSSGVIRAGNWKLIEAFETGEISLFNVADDIGEKVDWSGAESAKVAKLKAMWKLWRTGVGADLMKLNPEFTGESKLRIRTRRI